MSDTKPTTSRQAKRPRPGSPVKFANPKMSYAETQDRLAKPIGTQDRDLLGTFINQVVAVAELGEPSDDLEVTFSVSVIEDILSNHSNGGVAKAMLAAQYTAVHAMIMKLARRFSRIIAEPERLEIIVRLVASLARTSVAQYEALNRVHAGVTVGHVSVNEGGQAIVGSVTHNQQEPATQDAGPPQPLLAEAKSVPMPIIQESDDRIPVPLSRAEESKR
jgi:hypothetical protein